MASVALPPPEIVGTKANPIVATILRTLAYGVLIAFALAMIMPFIYAVANSFKAKPDIATYPQTLMPLAGEFAYTLEPYQWVFTSQQSDFPRWTFNSAFIAVCITISHVVLDSMAGYALARLNFPGKRILFISMLGTMMIPAIVLLVPRFIILKELGMTGTYQGLIVPAMVDVFGIFLMKQFFETIPKEIEEAAFVDGANRFLLFFRIVLPMATPALAALAIFGFQGAWNAFLDPLIVVINNRELYTLPLGLAILRGSQGNALEWDRFFASSVITTLPMAIIFFAFQRYFVEGVNYSGLAGQ